jgi:all-trans-retinol 13,14-reductase
MHTPRTCLILGSGMGGLALGALLARAGVEVTVLEAHPSFLGGYAHGFEMQGYRFTAGPRYLWNFGKGQIGHRFLEKCELVERVPMVELDRAGFDHLYIGDDAPISVPNGWSAYGELLKERFPTDAKGIDRFFTACQRAFRTFEVIDELGLYLEPWRTVLPKCLWRAPGSMGWMLLHRRLTLSQVFDWCALSHHVRAVLSAHGGIFGLPPDELSFHAYAAATLFYHRGCQYPANDMAGLIDALVETIEKRNGKILRGRRVTAVDAGKQGVKSVAVCTGEQFNADTVVVNFDPQRFVRMIRQTDVRDHCQLPAYRHSHSVSSLFLGIAKADLLTPHFGRWNNWYLATTEPMPRLYEADPREAPKMLYLNSPTLVKGATGDAPAGGATVTAFAPCSYRLMKQADSTGGSATLRAEHTRHLLEIIERRFIPGLRDALATVYLRTPDDNERLFQAAGGAVYGRAVDAHEVWRKLPFKGTLPNLFFVGAYVSFAGIASVVHSACRVYQELTGERV